MAQLFEKAEKIYPRRVSGTFRNLKWAAMIVLLGIYYGAPWLRYDRGPHVPNQAIFVDLAGQRGYFFGIEIWPQEVYLLVGLLILAAIGLFFATSLLGRAWCGYACPQTVWTDLFVWVERFVQGDRNARKRLDDGPWTLEKIGKKTLTHAIWLVIGALTGGAWVFYFNDAPTLAEGLVHLDLPASVWSWIVALTLSTYFMAGFARENICKYVCPYARFQSAMFDRDTLIISYAHERGEPRGKHKRGDSWEGRGHCIDCDSCVVVCPMGIDIRNGLQFDCISCGLCIDACNTVMEKVMLPRGLIHYDTENNQEQRFGALRAGQLPPKGRMRWIRPRTVFYAAIMSLVGALMLGAILLRSETDVNVIHNRSPQYVRLSSGDIRNNYQLKVLNKTHFDRSYDIAVDGLRPKNIEMLAAGDVKVSAMAVPANTVGEFRVQVITAPVGAGRTPVTFRLIDRSTGKVAKHASYFVQP
ncbi:cytochrome c oxidase accessory protein CcoG [Asticcacaulis biprosthecium C19]|uniref:Cytochrome c oxidase accessory protein CcoG n=1 Tax=Asticcacaulis biprosthecium C19 TaxID=715226 RepID=F4QTG5_9CAUL|nr:cytochrome c oxidase accessory protein CcoG [Asticcacaulis biprosthecium]EGF90035.1 cytochrome c oxidase accessory protein CcoG [Asticcacaulis biprosthecium C19]